VQVVNFVAQGSIEEGMLGVLAFKKSLFAGVLDGGTADVFMNGTRWTKFMENVEEVTRSTAETPIETDGAEAAREPTSANDTDAATEFAHPAEPQNTAPTGSEVAPTMAPEIAPEAVAEIMPTADPATAPAANPWAPLLEVGLQLLGSLANTGQPGQPPSPLLETDPKTGRAYLKLPLPEPATVQRLADALRDLLSGPRG